MWTWQSSANHQQDVSFVFPMWWAIPTFTHFPCKNRTSPWMVRIRDVAVLTEWQSWGATPGLTSTQSGALFTSAHWQFPHTKSSLIRASMDSWSANVGHSSVCTWSFPTFKEENLPHDFSLLDPWPSNSLPTTFDHSTLAAQSSSTVFSFCWAQGWLLLLDQFT